MGRNLFINDEDIPSDDILEGLYKLRVRESEKLKTVLELYNLEIHQKKLGPDYHRLKTMVKRSIEQNLRIKNFEARNGNYERNAVVKNQETKQREQKIWDIIGSGKPTGSVLKETIAVSVTISISVQKSTQPNPYPSSSTRQNEGNASRTRSPRGKGPSGRMSRWPCKDHLKGTCTNSVKNGILRSACSTSQKNDADLGKSALIAHRQVEEQPSKRSKKNGDKSAVATVRFLTHSELIPPTRKIEFESCK